MPGFYFDLRDEGAGYGMGFYQDNRGIMENLRARIREKPEAVAALFAPLSDFFLYAEPNRRMKLPEGVPGGAAERLSGQGAVSGKAH